MSLGLVRIMLTTLGLADVSANGQRPRFTSAANASRTLAAPSVTGTGRSGATPATSSVPSARRRTQFGTRKRSCECGSTKKK